MCVCAQEMRDVMLMQEVGGERLCRALGVTSALWLSDTTRSLAATPHLPSFHRLSPLLSPSVARFYRGHQAPAQLVSSVLNSNVQLYPNKERHS